MLQTLHREGIVHRDLKPENLLFVNDSDDSLKISDFGLAKLDGRKDVHKNVVGTPSYLSPEIITKNEYGPACDIWSLGVVVYIMLGGYSPFQAAKIADTLERIKKGKYKFHEDVWGSISSDAKDLVSRMLTVDVDSRISCDEILSHSWLVSHAEIVEVERE